MYYGEKFNSISHLIGVALAATGAVLLIVFAARLGDRFRVEVLVVLWEAESVLQVPASALFRQDSSWALFAVENGRARLRRVRVGHQSAQAVEIVAGLGRGATVIRHPTDQITDGVRISTHQTHQR